MKTLNDILETAKDATGSDYATAKALGVERQAISGWRHGRSQPNDKALAALADITKIEIAALFAIRAAEKAKGSEKEYWENFYKRLGGIAASVLVATALIHAPESHANTINAVNSTSSSLYIMSNCRWAGF